MASGAFFARRSSSPSSPEPRTDHKHAQLAVLPVVPAELRIHLVGLAGVQRGGYEAWLSCEDGSLARRLRNVGGTPERVGSPPPRE
jgi:hypothetical protein